MVLPCLHPRPRDPELRNTGGFENGWINYYKVVNHNLPIIIMIIIKVGVHLNVFIFEKKLEGQMKMWTENLKKKRKCDELNNTHCQLQGITGYSGYLKSSHCWVFNQFVVLLWESEVFGSPTRTCQPKSLSQTLQNAALPSLSSSIIHQFTCRVPNDLKPGPWMFQANRLFRQSVAHQRARPWCVGQ